MAAKTEAQIASEDELAKMKLRLACLQIARRQDFKGISDSQNDKVLDRAKGYWRFVEHGHVKTDGAG